MDIKELTYLINGAIFEFYASQGGDKAVCDVKIEISHRRTQTHTDT
jgi:hypothetical protein